PRGDGGATGSPRVRSPTRWAGWSTSERSGTTGWRRFAATSSDVADARRPDLIPATSARRSVRRVLDHVLRPDGLVEFGLGQIAQGKRGLFQGRPLTVRLLRDLGGLVVADRR